MSAMTYAKALSVGAGLLMSSTALAAGCSVERIEFVDHSRSIGVPYASAADPGSRPYRLQGLSWRPMETSPAAQARPDYSALQRWSSSQDPGDAIAGALMFHGLQPGAETIRRTLAEPSLCAALSQAAPRSGVTGVLIATALPPIFYEQLAVALAQRNLSVVAVPIGASENDLRLVVNAMVRDHGWDASRIGLVAHGQSGHAASLLAMQWGGARAMVSLDGFEAMAREQHPGLSSTPGWRPGLMRVPVLHWQPAGRPHASPEHYANAERSAYTKVLVPGLEASPWATAPQLAGAPPALSSLLVGLDESGQRRIAELSAQFLAAALQEGSALAWTPQGLPADWKVEHRRALTAPAIITDGELAEPIWRDARVLASDDDLSLHVAEDDEYFYLAIRSQKAEAFTTELMFDANADGAAHWSSDDLLLHASNSLCWSLGTFEFQRAGCGTGVAWWGASRSVRVGDPPVGEYFIAKRKLSPRLKVAARLSASETSRMLPSTARQEAPATWIMLR